MAGLRSSALCLIALAFGPDAAFAGQLRASTRRKQGCGHGQWLDVGSKRRASKSRSQKPGAGLGTITPFEESFNDGFSMVGCVKDDMLLHGDKFGDGKFSYKLGPITNVSIVHYTDTVPREDQEQMTHEACFGFCRTVPEMHFFGITNGRDCYCAPFYKQIASDSSTCDAVCDGNQATMCGGKTKSSIFEMHSCNDAEANLADASAKGEKARERLGAAAEMVKGVASRMQSKSASLQAQLGKVGDSAATDHLQAAKVFAGKLEHTSEAGQKLMESLDTMLGGASALKGGDVQSLEDMTSNLHETIEKAKALSDELEELQKEALPPRGPDSAELYYPVMYFVDKEYSEAPSTCGGKALGKPILGGYSGCAGACEATAGKCVGFSYMEGGLCFLLSELETATYYTGCDKAEEAAKTGAFLQRAKKDDDYDDYYAGPTPDWMEAGPKEDNYNDYGEDSQSPDYSEGYEPEAETPADDDNPFTCVVKFANFNGQTLKPDPSGKCKECLKEAKKADRCISE